MTTKAMSGRIESREEVAAKEELEVIGEGMEEKGEREDGGRGRDHGRLGSKREGEEGLKCATKGKTNSTNITCRET